MRKTLSKPLVIDPTAVIEELFQHAPAAIQRCIKVRNGGRLLFQAGGICKDEFVHDRNTFGARDFCYVKSGNPTAKGFAYKACFLHFHLPEKFIQEIHESLNAIGNKRLVRVSEADLVRNKQAMIF